MTRSHCDCVYSAVRAAAPAIPAMARKDLSECLEHAPARRHRDPDGDFARDPLAHALEEGNCRVGLVDCGNDFEAGGLQAGERLPLGRQKARRPVVGPRRRIDRIASATQRQLRQREMPAPADDAERLYSVARSQLDSARVQAAATEARDR